MSHRIEALYERMKVHRSGRPGGKNEEIKEPDTLTIEVKKKDGILNLAWGAAEL